MRKGWDHTLWNMTEPLLGPPSLGQRNRLIAHISYLNLMLRDDPDFEPGLLLRAQLQMQLADLDAALGIEGGAD